MKKVLMLFRIIIMAAAFCMPVLSKAQPPGDEDVDDVPLDGGLSILIAAGIGYGAKKALEKRKKAVSFDEVV